MEGAGGAPTVFNSPANMADHNVFDVSLPIQDEMVPFVNWIASMPASQRPKTAAYPMADDPFATPPVQLAQKELQALGVKTVYSQIFPEEVADYKAPADQVAATGAQIVVLGSTDVLAGTLSYGQRKLLELAYVLVADPAVILLDEPAGGVNLSLVNQIADRIRELNAAGKTFLIVEHNMEFVMGLCDRVTVLDSGTVVAAGPPDIVRTDRRVLDAYLGEDFGASQDDPGEAHDGVAR